ncbi:MAG: NUDIX domain-containing protein [Anaerococcus sp.]|uniref:NUDIX hydrolase n=1 Tax=Anaerococcus sp. TaxID=1872515 RepID=UPI002603E9B3|nr:NUDIX domain-containing protein [Anaerococcus sp.]MCI5971712.1 NUDIX domain-containing protein [Anaerococcus sp.]MDD6919413.1 NUDIX domain-containing protein [Peptoniphilaceae bacterium]MDY2927867.1 NUDIX domain-containing protein [Anaerococcus sp.]
MEILDLYDENRIKTGKTYIRGEKMPDDTYRLIVHLLIFDDWGNLLIQKRQKTKSMANLWDITCGGAASAGETSKEAISRELKEELGFSIDFTSIRPILTANFKHGFDDFYLVRKNINLDEVKLQEEEVAACKWASFDEVMDLMERERFVRYKKNFIRLLFDLNDDLRVVEI